MTAVIFNSVIQTFEWFWLVDTARKVPKYGVISGPYFPACSWIRRDISYLSVFSPNVGKHGPEITPYLDTFCAVWEGCFDLLIFLLRKVSKIKLSFMLVALLLITYLGHIWTFNFLRYCWYSFENVKLESST